MTRRMFWAGVGAAAGISGYRRVSRRIDSLTGSAGTRAAADLRRGDEVRAGPGAAAGPRAGSRPRAVAGPAAAAAARLGVRMLRASGRTARRQVGRGTAGFLGDVRDGMAEYLAQHSPGAANTLDRDRRALPPAGAGNTRRFRRIDYVKDDR